MLSTGISNIHGKQRVEGVTLSKLDSNRNPIEGTEEFIKCDTVLLSVGLIPENELSVEAGVKLDTRTSGPIVRNSMETNIDGVFACGNVVHVHDLVDFVTKESRIAGKNAALYYLNKLENKETVSTVANEGITYIVPQNIDTSCGEDVNLFMRVRSIFKNKKLVVRSNDKVILEKRRPHMIPSEMENIKIGKDLFKDITGDITVSVEEA
ncbi:Ferredoxin--NADP reductase [bioreactor metagenome]